MRHILCAALCGVILNGPIVPAAGAAVPDAQEKAEPKQPQRHAEPRPPAPSPPRHAEPKPPAQKPPKPPAPPPTHRGSMVFVGGYFYDPFFGPYPWWARPVYPYAYYPTYDRHAAVRIAVTPKTAEVYVDGFYAGIVDEFDGIFQSLPLPPGGHEIVVFREGLRTLRQRLYLSPGTTYTIERPMEPLRPDERSEPPLLAPLLPPPPAGTFREPKTAASRSTTPPEASAISESRQGVLALRVQPGDATVTIDGEHWASSDGGRFELELPAGSHHLMVQKRGRRSFETDVDVTAGDTTTLNVTLAADR